MANVILVNRTKRPRRMLVFNLTKAVAATKIETRTTEETKQGERRKRVQTKLVPAALRVPHGVDVEVDEKWLAAPEVAKAISRRELLVKRPDPPAAKNGNGNGGPRPRKRRG